MFARKSNSAAADASESFGWNSPKTFNCCRRCGGRSGPTRTRPARRTSGRPQTRSMSSVFIPRSRSSAYSVAEVLADGADKPDVREEARRQRKCTAEPPSIRSRSPNGVFTGVEGNRSDHDQAHRAGQGSQNLRLVGHRADKGPMTAMYVVRAPLLVLLDPVGRARLQRARVARNKVDEAWSGIDVQLKRRHDLVPNLVETSGLRRPRARDARPGDRGAGRGGGCRGAARRSSGRGEPHNGARRR